MPEQNNARAAVVYFTAVACGGAIGTLLRWAVIVATSDSASQPWITFAVNIIGCFALGLVTVAIVQRVPHGHWLRPLLCVGVLGSFTTFSAFSIDAMSLLESDAPWLGGAYVVGSFAAGLLAAVSGMAAASLAPTGQHEEMSS